MGFAVVGSLKLMNGNIKMEFGVYRDGILADCAGVVTFGVGIAGSKGVFAFYNHMGPGISAIGLLGDRDISVVRTSQGDGSLSRHAGDGQGHRLAVGQDD